MVVRYEYPKALGHFMNDFFSTDVLPSKTAVPAVDILELEKEIVVVAELPGVKRDEVKISFEQNRLLVEAERAPFEISENARILLNEVQERKYRRSIQFASKIDIEKISAELTNGILRIVLPKVESAKARTIEVK